MKLTQDIRRAIRKDLMEHTFAGVYEELLDKFRILADRVYRDIFDAPTRRKMDRLPKGWLPERNCINIMFGEENGSYESLYFNGDFGYGYLRPKGFINPEVCHRMPTVVGGDGVGRIYDRKSPIALDYYALANEVADQTDRYEKAEKLATSTLGRIITTRQLVEAWPEVMPFAEKHLGRVAMPALPVVPVDVLNRTFRLPT